MTWLPLAELDMMYTLPTTPCALAGAIMRPLENATTKSAKSPKTAIRFCFFILYSTSRFLSCYRLTVGVYLRDWRDVVDVWSRSGPVLAKGRPEEDKYSQHLRDVYS